MTDRITRLHKLLFAGNLSPKTVKVEFDREDLFLPREVRETKRIREYVLSQEPVVTEDSALTGLFLFDGSVVGDAFRRGGHTATQIMMADFYCKPVQNLSTQEWQHATADYKKVLSVGIDGIKNQICESEKCHTAPEETAFLEGLLSAADTLILWAHKCAEKACAMAEKAEDAAAKMRLSRLADALLYVPEFAPRSFYEAVLSIAVTFSYDPDSLGTLDRYLAPFYEADLASGCITREEAAEYLQELYLMVASFTNVKSDRFTRGGESHFCVGGYLPDGRDGFCDTSRLIVDALMDLPLYIPQVSLRWTAKTPREVLRYMMDCERKDPNKRIAFQNDEKRIKCYTEICHIPFERAVSYTTVGCNEPAFLGAITGSNSKVNIARCVETLFHRKADAIRSAESFEAFYEIFLQEMFSDILLGYDYDNKYNLERAKDLNYVSSLIFNDCIENAKSLTQGGGNVVIASPMYMGMTNVIDSLIAVKQFVYDEKAFTMAELIDALQTNWASAPGMREMIRRRGDFFGNDTQRSNEVAQRLYRDLYEFLKDRTNVFGYHWLIGDLMGYNEHPKWFGEHTKATPDGRVDGETLKFGMGQTGGYDRNGLTALLNSIAKADPNGITCGSTVTNVMIEEELVRNDAYFEKMVDLFEAYFKAGGVHFQLTYVSREELQKAKVTPEEYGNLRVRVSGFSDYFVKLADSIQDEIIERTVQK